MLPRIILALSGEGLYIKRHLSLSYNGQEKETFRDHRCERTKSKIERHSHHRMLMIQDGNLLAVQA